MLAHQQQQKTAMENLQVYIYTDNYDNGKQCIVVAGGCKAVTSRSLYNSPPLMSLRHTSRLSSVIRIPKRFHQGVFHSSLHVDVNVRVYVIKNVTIIS